MIEDILFNYIIRKIKERAKITLLKKLGLYIKSLDKKRTIKPHNKHEIICYVLSQIEQIKQKQFILSDDIIKQIRIIITNPPPEDNYYTLSGADLDNYIQTMQICIDGKNMLQDASGILYDVASENNIIGKINDDNKIEWYTDNSML